MLHRFLVRLLPCLLAASPLAAQSAVPSAAPAINALGLDLYRQQAKSAGRESILLSPFSIASALAMTYAGADGDTRAEMHNVLHFPADQAASSMLFQTIARQLAGVVAASDDEASFVRKTGGRYTPLRLDMANKLFVQQGYTLKQDFLDDLHDHFAAGPDFLDFKIQPESARKAINDWVAAQTNHRITHVLSGALPKNTRLMLVNALYMRAGWQHEFEVEDTRPESFHLSDGRPAQVPTMQMQYDVGYAKQNGYTAVTLPYAGGKLQFVLMVPDDVDGLAAIEQKLTVADLQEFAHLKHVLVKLHLPKFKLDPGTIPLGQPLRALGLKTAFDQPRGSANFERMAMRRPDEYLYLGEVVHKTWLSLDEHGTEAAAATAGIMLATFGIAVKPPTPIEVRANRPFLFAIQHVDSGACLFIGRVMDPR